MTISSQFHTERPKPERQAIDGLISRGMGRSPYSVRTVAGTSRDCVR